MNLLSISAIVLLAWGLITLIRRIAETEQADPRTHSRADAQKYAPDPEGAHTDDEIDHEALERAEDEVRDLGTDARPEDGFEGDDWGPGAPRRGAR